MSAGEIAVWAVAMVALLGLGVDAWLTSRRGGGRRG